MHGTTLLSVSSGETGKDTVDDKKLRRFIEARRSYADQDTWLELDVGSVHAPINNDRRVARKYFFYLLATLNAVFPDYDYR